MISRIMIIVGKVVEIEIGMWIYLSGGKYVREDD